MVVGCRLLAAGLAAGCSLAGCRLLVAGFWLLFTASILVPPFGNQHQFC